MAVILAITSEGTMNKAIFLVHLIAETILASFQRSQCMADQLLDTIAQLISIL
jgi:hypothetical protein